MEQDRDDIIPRSANLERFSPAERAIYDATAAVERMPADPRLTEAVVLLGQARAKVAAFVDDAEAVARAAG